MGCIWGEWNCEFGSNVMHLGYIYESKSLNSNNQTPDTINKKQIQKQINSINNDLFFPIIHQSPDN